MQTPKNGLDKSCTEGSLGTDVHIEAGQLANKTLMRAWHSV